MHENGEEEKQFLNHYLSTMISFLSNIYACVDHTRSKTQMRLIYVGSCNHHLAKKTLSFEAHIPRKPCQIGHETARRILFRNIV